MRRIYRTSCVVSNSVEEVGDEVGAAMYDLTQLRSAI